MKAKTHTTIDIGPTASSKKVRISRKQCKCSAAWQTVQEAYRNR
jgi:hypothetical protein